MFAVGDLVRVNPPFEASFPDTYTVESVGDDGSGTPCFWLAGIDAPFVADFLRAA